MLRRFLVVAVAYLGLDGVAAGGGGKGRGLRRIGGTPKVVCRKPGHVGHLRVKAINCFGVKSGKKLKLGRPYVNAAGHVVAKILFRDGKKVDTFVPGHHVAGTWLDATVTLSYNPRNKDTLRHLWNRAPDATFTCRA